MLRENGVQIGDEEDLRYCVGLESSAYIFLLFQQSLFGFAPLPFVEPQPEKKPQNPPLL